MPVKLPQGVHINVTSKYLEKNEINLIGRKVDEAVDIVDKFLDDAFLAQMSQVRIVHGMGTGALRQAIWDAARGVGTVVRRVSTGEV